jgi:HD-GYP domain-containing protein (c-di-GMP phosphodiesterase class II)
MSRTRTIKTAILALCLLAVAALAGAQAERETIGRARALYFQGGDFQAALAELSRGMPESSPDAKLKAEAAGLCTEMGRAEQDAKNWKNAWDAYRKALKYQPTNTLAAQGYLAIKKSRDPAKLQNEGEQTALATKKAADDALAKKAVEDEAASKAKAAEDEAARKAKAAEDEAARKVQDAEAASRAAEEAAARKAREEQDLKRAIEEAVAKAQATQPQGVTSSDLEKLMSKLETTQASSAKSGQSAETVKQESAALKAQLDQQRAINRETLKTLSSLAEKQSQREKAPAAVETDPIVKLLSDNLAEQRKALEAESAANRRRQAAIIAAVCALFALFVGFLLLVYLRARARAREANRLHSAAFGAPASGAYSLAAAPSLGLPAVSNVPLLEFSSHGRDDAVDLRKQLLRAERMNKMYEDARAGTLSWDTVRRYIDELDTALKSDILGVVDAKLSGGDLVDNQAVLPLLFPFLTDSDDYIRERAEKTARQALLEDRTGSAPSDDSPFSLRSLMAIPERLKAILKGRDQSVVTARLSRGMAKVLGLSNADCQEIYLGALAHDVGYLTLDVNELQRVISKTEITEEEFEFIKSHATSGLSYFGELEVPGFIRDAIASHHERNDGSGYPDGRRKEEIPLIGKIIGAAESYAALLGPRPDRPRMSADNALAIIKDARMKFDPEIISALASVAKSNGGYR